MRTMVRGKLTLLFMALAMVMAIPAVALADNLQDEVTAGNQTMTITAGDPNGFTNHYWIQQTGSDGCNVNATNPATFKLNVPSGVNASTTDLTFSACSTEAAAPSPGAKLPVKFTSNTANATGYEITASYVSGGIPGNNGWNVQNAKLTLKVNPAPTPSDTTPPVITPDIQGTLGNNGWYTSNVSLSWSVVDNESAISSQSGCDAVSITSDQAATTYTCEATSAGGTSSESVTIKRDATAPTVTPGNVNDTTWRNSSLSQAFEASDGGSGLADPNDANFTLTASDESTKDSDGNVVPTTVSKTVSDLAGNSTQRTLSAKIDLTKPDLGIVDSNVASYDVCGSARPVEPAFNPSDALSGLFSSNSVWTPNLQPSGVGSYSYYAEAQDNAGNSDRYPASGTKTYSVNYGNVANGGAYDGVLAPVNRDGSSNFKLGSTIPVKFKLACSASGSISNAVAHISVRSAGSANGDINENISTAAPHDGTQFRYDATNQQYIFNLSTKNLSAGKWNVTITLDDGSTRSASFDLRK